MKLAILFFGIVIPFFSVGQDLVARIEHQTKWSLIDERGVVIQTRYGHINNFSDGLAGFRGYGGLWGFTDNRGNEIIPASYTKVGLFSCGIAPVANELGQWSYINKKGEIVLPGPFSSAKACSEGLMFACPSSETVFYLYNSVGEKVTEDSYKEVYPFIKGKAVVRVKGNTWRIINTKGETVHEGSYVFLDSFEGGFARFKSKYGWGYMDSTYKIAFTGWYAHAQNFYQGYARVDKTVGPGDTYMINTSGDVMNWEFLEIKNFSENLVRVLGPNKKWGYMDREGKLVIPFQFMNSRNFSEGLALVKEWETGLWGYINKSGDWIIKPDLQGGRSFKNGYAIVKFQKGGFWSYMDHEGKAFSGRYDHVTHFERTNEFSSEADESLEEE